MDRSKILQRIEELRERLSNLRRHRNDSLTSIAVEAIEQELTRTAARLPPEWDFLLSGVPGGPLLKREVSLGGPFIKQDAFVA